MAFRHAKVSTKPDGSDSSLVQPSDWNADHVIPGQAAGDLIYFNGTEWTRLAVGTAGQVLTVSSGSPSWQNPSGGGGGFPSNPQPGDLVYYDGSAWVRLPAGTPNGTQLTIISGSPAWAEDPALLFQEAPFLPNPITTWRSFNPFSGAGTTLTLTAGRCYFIPVWVGRPRALTDLGIEVSTASAGTAEVAIYASNGTSTRPGTRLAYVSGLDTGTTGVRSAAVSVTIQPGLVWAALRASAGATVRATATVPGFSIVTGGNNRGTHLYNADASLANPVTTDPTTIGVGTVPHIYARWS